MALRVGMALSLAALVLAPAISTAADTLRISSTPSGAKVEIDGIAEGTTPFEKNYPGGYFHKTRTSLGARLEHPMVARITLPGYVPKEVRLTDGPMNWISLNGRNRGEYWLLKSTHFEVELQRVKETFTGEVAVEMAGGRTGLRSELSLEELVRRTKPAVIFLRGAEKSGSGFFVSDTGLIATNAHVARDEESLRAVLPDGEELDAKVLYLDGDLDIALAKVKGENFPHLTLADVSTVQQGEDVVAIGNPGDAMLFSATKGIVSAVGAYPGAGPGTWIQTDTPINPGNSGGPLLNMRGEVVGINTQKLVKKNVNGIGFALSASDLIEVLQRFYPNSVPATEKLSTPTSENPVKPATPFEESLGTVTFSGLQGAQIEIDGLFVGEIPGTYNLTVGRHNIVVRAAGRTDWIHVLTVFKDSRTTLTIFQDSPR